MNTALAIISFVLHFATSEAVFYFRTATGRISRGT